MCVSVRLSEDVHAVVAMKKHTVLLLLLYV